MKKRYKLKIPDMIPKEKAAICEKLYLAQGHIIDTATDSKGCGRYGLWLNAFDCYIPWSWLEEVKEAMTFEQWSREQGIPEIVDDAAKNDYLIVYYPNFRSLIESDRKRTWYAALENDKNRRGEA